MKLIRRPGPKYRHLLTLRDRHADAGHWTPCGADPDRWTSEDAATRAAAARDCAPCPVRAECAIAAREFRPTFGVWGGKDRTTTRKDTAR